MCGCGIRDPYNYSSRPSGTPAHATHPPASPAAIGGGQLPGAAVILRFAGLAANVSAQTENAHLAQLIALAAPPLRGELRAHSAAIALAALRGIAAGARMVASVSIETLQASGPWGEKGRIVVDTREQQSDGASEPPLAEVYDVALTRSGSRWSVAEFQPQP